MVVGTEYHPLIASWMSTFINPLEKFQLRSSPPPVMARPATRQSSVASDGVNTAVAAKQVDTPSSKRSRNRPSRFASESVSPPRRRATRSQSRELEAAGVKSHVKKIEISTNASATRRGARGKGEGKMKGKGKFVLLF